MKKIMFSYFTVLTILFLFPWPALGVTIYLRDTGYAHGNYIELNEIATIDGTDDARWGNIVIGKTSKKQQKFTAQQIKSKIDSSRIIDESYTIIGELVTVITPYTKITQFEIEMEIKSALKKLFPADWSKTFLIYTQETGDIDIPLGDFKICVDVDDISALYGSKEISIKIFLNDHLFVEKKTRVTIQGRIKVLYLKRAVYAGHQVTVSDVMYNEIILKKDLSNHVFSFMELTGYIAKHYLSPGTPLLRSSLEKKLLVLQSQQIEIVLQVGSAVLYTDGEALSSGGFGETISVKSRFGNKVFSAKIIAEGKVEVIK